MQGKGVCEHLTDRLLAMEREAAKRDKSYAIPELPQTLPAAPESAESADLLQAV